MPCDGSYMNPSQKEIESLEVCKRIIFLFGRLGFAIPSSILEAATSQYGDLKNLDRNIDLLCMAIRQMTEDQKQSIIYNGRNKESRKLANWWEEHTEADSKKKPPTAEEIQEAKILFSVLSSLPQMDYNILEKKIKKL